MATLYAREKPEPAPEFKVTAVLSAYRRVENLVEQIQALRNQTVSTDIWVDYTVPEGEEMVDILNIAPGVKLTVHTNQNVNYMRRFYNALNVPTGYVFICDDDIIPGKNYIQHCLDTMEQIGDCILVGYGIRFRSGARNYHKRNRVPHGWSIGPDQMQKHPIQVDMGGQSWFFRKNISPVLPVKIRSPDSPEKICILVSACRSMRAFLFMSRPIWPGNMTIGAVSMRGRGVRPQPRQ